MWYSKQLRKVRRARKVARTQQHELLNLELEGVVAITLHSITRTLTVPTERTAGVQVIDLLGQGLREHRQMLKEEARQLRQDWQESEALRGRSPSRADQSLPDEPTTS
jgi:hypothetical protein